MNSRKDREGKNNMEEKAVGIVKVHIIARVEK